ncbi:hypothetical protein QAC19_14345, partial [Staphylococcus aureus]
MNKAKSKAMRAAMRSVNMTRVALRRQRKLKPRAGSEYLAVSSDAAALSLTAYGLDRLPVALVAVVGNQVVARFEVAGATVGRRDDAYTAAVDYRKLVDALREFSVDSLSTEPTEDDELDYEEADDEGEGWKVRLGWLLESSDA